VRVRIVAGDVVIVIVSRRPLEFTVDDGSVPSREDSSSIVLNVDRVPNVPDPEIEEVAAESVGPREESVEPLAAGGEDEGKEVLERFFAEADRGAAELQAQTSEAEGDDKVREELERFLRE